MKKRFLSTMMALVLALSLLPVSALAAEVTVPANGSLQDAINSASSGDTITVTGDITSSVPITIANKSLTIVGSGDTKPTINAIFQIAHTDNGGPYTVTFENIKFAPTVQGNVIEEKSTNATSADNVNQLVVENCEFKLTVDHGSATRAVIAIVATQQGENYVTGAQLTFQGNRVKTTSYDLASGSGYYTVVVDTSATSSTLYGPDVYNFAKHTIANNTIQGHFYYAFIGGYADITGNTVDLKYYTGEDGKTDTGARAFQIRGAQADNHGGQLDLTVTGNHFSNMEQFFKLYALDTLLDSGSGWNLKIAGSDEENKNTFEGIQTLGEAESSAMLFGNQLAMQFAKEKKKFEGITDDKLALVMENITFQFQQTGGELYSGKMTLDDGSQVTTYTQPTVADVEARTGFYSEVEGKKYWYFASRADFATLHYFVDDNNAFYITCLSGGGNASALTLAGAEYPGYETASATENHGKLYTVDFSIQTDGFHNTYYNATPTLSEETDTLTLTPTQGNTVKNINAFISSIGTYSTLYVTDDASAGAPAGALKLVVPDTSTNKMAQLLVSAAIDVVVDANIANVDIINRCGVTVNSGNTVDKLEIGEEAAVGSALVNNGAIGNVDIFARTDFTNNGTVTKLAVGDDEPGGIARRKETCRLAAGTEVSNLGSMDTVILFGQATLTNGSESNETASIQKLTVGFKGLMDDETNLPYATDSSIINYGVMCNKNSDDHDIYLNTRCTFDNKGIIGAETGRTPPEGQTYSSCICNGTNTGGMIYIGYSGYSDAHDGLVFTNSGTIYAGSRHNGSTHQMITLFVFGVQDGYGDSASVQIYNEGSGKIYGYAYIANYQADDLTHTLTDVGEQGAAATTAEIKTKINLTISADKPVLSGGGNVTLTVSGLPADAEGVTVTCEGIEITDNGDGTYTATLPNATQTYTFTVTYNEISAACTISVTAVSTGGSSGSTRYTVSVPSDVDNGTVTVSPSRASRGSTVTVTVTPNEGYELDALTVTDSDGNELTLTDKGDGKYTFTMPRGAVEIAASFVPAEEEPQPSDFPFTDVAENAWYYDAVVYAWENDLMTGTSSTTFAPGVTTSRAMLATLLYRLEGAPDLSGENLGYPYADVEADSWYGDGVYWARLHGVVTGVTGEIFDPDGDITREQMAVMLYRYAQYKGYDVTGSADLSGYADADSVSSWAQYAVAWAVDAGLISGVGNNTLNPQGSATRAEIATILMRFVEGFVPAE